MSQPGQAVCADQSAVTNRRLSWVTCASQWCEVQWCWASVEVRTKTAWKIARRSGTDGRERYGGSTVYGACQQESFANDDLCLSVDPAAEVREAHGVQSLPHQQRQVACGQHLACESPILPQQLQPAAASLNVPSHAALESMSVDSVIWSKKTTTAENRAFVADRNKLLTARREAADI